MEKFASLTPARFSTGYPSSKYRTKCELSDLQCSYDDANSRGDITHVQVDAIVNAANTGLLGAPSFVFWTGHAFPVPVQLRSKCSD